MQNPTFRLPVRPFLAGNRWSSWLLLLFFLDRVDSVERPTDGTQTATATASAAAATTDDDVVLVLGVTVSTLLMSPLLPLTLGDTGAASRGGTREAKPSGGSEARRIQGFFLLDSCTRAAVHTRLLHARVQPRRRIAVSKKPVPIEESG